MKPHLLFGFPWGKYRIPQSTGGEGFRVPQVSYESHAACERSSLQTSAEGLVS